MNFMTNSGEPLVDVLIDYTAIHATRYWVRFNKLKQTWKFFETLDT